MMNTTLLTPPTEGALKLTPREEETQAAVWALIFLLAEVSLVIRILRDRLTERGALLPEDEALINEAASKAEFITGAYQHVETGFREKFNRILFAARNPQAVEQAVRESQASPQPGFTPPDVPVFENTAEPPTQEPEKDE